MAKKENTEEVMGGLTGPKESSVVDGLNFGAAKDVKTVDEVRPTAKPDPVKETPAPMISLYGNKKREEHKSFKTNVLLKPSHVERIDAAVEDGRIKSRNAFINELLEQHFDLEDAITDGRIKNREDFAKYLMNHYFLRNQ